MEFTSNKKRKFIDHQKWLNGDLDGVQALIRERDNFTYEDLRKAMFLDLEFHGGSFAHANLEEACFRECNLRNASFKEARLRNVRFLSCQVQRVNFTNQDLREAVFLNCSLQNSLFYGADLRGANLRGTDLRGIHIHRARVHGVHWPSPGMVLLANWWLLPPDLTALAMAYDASQHPDPESFDRWAEGGPCPYDDISFERACNFQESRKYWKPGLKAPSAFELALLLLQGRCDLRPEDTPDVSDDSSEDAKGTPPKQPSAEDSDP